MKLAWVKLKEMCHDPHFAWGELKTDTTRRAEFKASAGYEIEDSGPFLLIRGSAGVEVTSTANVVDGRELVEEPRAAQKGKLK